MTSSDEPEQVGLIRVRVGSGTVPSPAACLGSWSQGDRRGLVMVQSEPDLSPTWFQDQLYPDGPPLLAGPGST